ncbi:2-succinyl-5-enolpyruvyl-6-hydroxy-3-cyclohexene-1-carboxylic-acid synthase [Nakamurella leprariae]|uniref:2-succinyl-5-enolpyruvyl-6-hydroxy-3-cyclohexene-1-carboxylate synthase n=1 Tax=Nakamurella leprariae TaxID=2803911 RepID=A0A938Y573_9ACTN|nr:2-succinyl-5-enolpyruvyl-6-hydroxy-3-cyclohexene-1-carboxylic-acid synthase [Nakamurella leprariae]MBM9466261.1 2-succinyl-5-enolpyruvyl-6-hydroxy-3-cyclohexene-1-carboxylic-acid synthase [Nakamurella leprariae]
MNSSTAIAQVLVDELVRCGITDAVLAPGSRNAPLSMALHDADVLGRLRLHVRIDERTAGFLALGLARGSGRPVPVITTSGTAVANLHPAVLEAHHGGVPLLVLSTDRPAQLRDVGANQVIDQRTVFSSALRLFHEFALLDRTPTDDQLTSANAYWRSMIGRAVAAAAGGAGRCGPVQLNVPLMEPLLPPALGTADPSWPAAWADRPGPVMIAAELTGPLSGRPGGRAWTSVDVPVPDTSVRISQRPSARPRRLLVVAELGDPRAAQLAAAGHVVVSEVGGADGGDVLGAGVQLLEVPELLEIEPPEQVLVLGRPTLHRAVRSLLARPAGPIGWSVEVVAPPADFPDPAGQATSVRPDLGILPAADQRWAERWREADRAAVAAVQAELDGLPGTSSPRAARDLVRALPTEAVLVLGSSQVPRDVALAALPRDGLRVVANRGVAGIDGLVSTAVGVGLAMTDRPTVAYLGDLSFVHDLTGLAIGPAEPRPDLTLVINNNDGGGIFTTLESGAASYAPSFERIFGTPLGLDLSGWAAACHIPFTRVPPGAELAAAIGNGTAERGIGIRLVEVVTDRTRLREDQLRLRRAARDAARRAVTVRG